MRRSVKIGLMKYLLVYLFAFNVVAFVAYAMDKSAAIRGAWRIPEKTLMLLATIGGSVGALAGMVLCRHKIRKPKFFLGVPLCLIVHFALIAWGLQSGVLAL